VRGTGNPAGSLLQTSDGAFYGVTIYGGTGGTIFRATPDGNITNIFEFPNVSSGNGPRAGLIQAANGLLYGTAISGGANFAGTVFSISTSGQFNLVAPFKVDVTGFQPMAPLIQAPDGLLYGTTMQNIFRVSTNGELTSVVMFPVDYLTGTHPKGSSCFAGLVLGLDGAFYGTTDRGGRYDKGTVFRVTTNGPSQASSRLMDLMVGVAKDH
jgi:uncharacterized repeat protein (TIGR03803 family)